MAAPPRWVARLALTESLEFEPLLEMPLWLDVWQRDADALVIAAPKSQLAELERRRLANVERIETVDLAPREHFRGIIAQHRFLS